MQISNLVRIDCELHSSSSNHELWLRLLLLLLVNSEWSLCGLGSLLDGLWLIFYFLHNPLLSIKRACVVGFNPFVNAMEMEVMAALALDRRAVVSAEGASVARHLIRILTDTARCFIANKPFPRSHCKPTVYLNSHFKFQ